MPTWNSRGLRGSTLEDRLNRTNEKYAHNGLALIQKIPTPITPVRMDKEHRQITLAYFEQRSTVDYIGVVQGIGYYEKSGGSVQEAVWRRPLDSGPSEMICRAVPRRGRRSFSGKTSGAGAGQAGR